MGTRGAISHPRAAPKGMQNSFKMFEDMIHPLTCNSSRQEIKGKGGDLELSLQKLGMLGSPPTATDTLWSQLLTTYKARQHLVREMCQEEDPR